MYTPAEVKNAKAKVIEPYFMYLNKKHCQGLRNWSGFNLDSRKDNQVNKEWLDKIKDTLPGKQEVIQQIEKIMRKERANKIVAYMAKWAQFPVADRRPMSDMDYLQSLGTLLNQQSPKTGRIRTNKTTGQGIIKIIDGEEYVYDSFEPAFRENMHIDWKLYGNMDDLGQVLAVSPDDKMKFMLEGKRILPMDIYSTTQDDVDYRMAVKGFNKDRMGEITTLAGRDADMVREILEDTPFRLNDGAEMDLKLLLTYDGQQKEKLQDAKGLAIVKKKETRRLAQVEADNTDAWEKKRQAYLNERTDLSSYQ